MDCDRCGNYIDEFATCPDCVGELEQRAWAAEEAAKRTPVELAAEELLDVANLVLPEMEATCENCGKVDESICEDCSQLEPLNRLRNIIAKAQDNPSPLPNPPAQDAHKSVE